MTTRCADTLGRDRCEKAQGHDGFHRWRDHLWGFIAPEPEWRRRMRAGLLPAKEMTR